MKIGDRYRNLKALGVIVAVFISGPAAATSPDEESAAAGPRAPGVLVHPNRWLPSNEIPNSVRRELRGQRAEFRLDIDRAGDVSACTLSGEAITERIEQTICEILVRNARFSPGLDENGVPAPGYYTSGITF